MKQGIFSSSYGDIYYELSGAEDSPTLVFIHGVGMDHATFQEQLNAFQPQYRTLVWDLPGHGTSSLKNYNKRFTELSADCLHELLEALRITQAVLIGQSLGSIVAQYFQLKHPDKVLAVAHAPGIELKSHVGKWARKLVPFFIFLIDLIPEKMFYQSFGKHRAVIKEVQDYLSATMKKTGKKFALKITADMSYDLIDPSPQAPKVPLLMLFGEKDLAFIRNASRKWHRSEPLSQYIEIPNANHIANQDNPEAFNRVLRQFLEALFKNN
ncbi:MAG: alpha/beta hydrolase [Mongoliibacter sp.]|uniref:alpha/beta fold hydrolase n=1 Tax=Mongoliibacter sp. TaxID=2022438 RepID=UPI0012F1CDEF|nr:alpha/beta hydrolase [Mongoliibacter sp.]TVP43193.1 MAG: alpha/beta hydrolase [Mongoliibacter sp.]